MKSKEMDRKFQEGIDLWNQGKSQEGAEIWMDLAELGHLESIEQLVYIFFDQKDFDFVETLISFAKDPNEPIILYLKARKIEESVGFEESIKSFEFAVKSGSADACRRLFIAAIYNEDINQAEIYLEKLRNHPAYFANPYVSVTLEDLIQELDELRERLANEAIQDGKQIDEILGEVVAISIKSLNLEKMYSQKNLASTLNFWKKEEKSTQEYWKKIYSSGHPDTSRDKLLSFLKSAEFDERRLAALNPNLTTSESAAFYNASFESRCSERFIEIQRQNDIEFERTFNIKQWNLSREDLKVTKGYIQTMVGKSLDPSQKVGARYIPVF